MYGDLGTGMKVVVMVQQQHVYMDVGGTCSQKGWGGGGGGQEQVKVDLCIEAKNSATMSKHWV